MRLVHAITSVDLRLGGTARAALDLAGAMAGRGHEVTLLTTDATDVPKGWTGGAQPSSLVDAGLAPRLGAKAAADATMAVLREADAVHIHAMWEPFNARVAALCAKIGTPYIVTPHGMLDDWCMAQGAWKKRVYMRLVGRRMLESAAFVHCTARAELMQSQRWFPNGSGIVVPNLMDLAPFAKLPGTAEALARWPRLASHDVRLLFLSRLNPKKGVEHLIDATAKLAREGLDVVAMVAGPADAGYGEKLAAHAQSAGVADRIEFLGHVGGTLKLSLIEACDMMVIPSSQENFGFVFFEALAAGLPVVTTDLVDTRDELAASGGAAIVRQDGAAVARGVREVLAWRPERPTRMAAARAWVFRELEPSTVSSQFDSMYARAAAMRTR
jgi:glycosyltransferase involved in cell wall biosynthesis